MNKTDSQLLVASVGLAGAVFAIDVILPLGVAAGIPYVGLVLVGWWFSTTRPILVLACVGTALTLVGYWISPEGGTEWIVALNRALAIFVIWTTAIILRLAKISSLRDLQATEHKYTDLVNNAPIGIVEVTPEGKFFSVNPAFAEMLGYETPEEIINTITDIQGQLYVSPEKRAKVVESLQGEGRSIIEYSELYRKDGSTIWISENAGTIRDDEGNIIRHESFVRDVTERKKQEEELKENARFLEQASELAKIGFWVCDHKDFSYPFWSRGMDKI